MSSAQTTLKQREQTAQLAWTGFILAFFMIQAVIWTVAISITANDRSHVVLADYDQQSVNWDQIQSRKRASAALGWQLGIFLADEADVMANRELKLTLTDRTGQPIQVSTIQLEAFHCSFGADVQAIRLQPTEPGVYIGTIQVRKFGQWQFRGTITNDNRLFLVDQRIEVESRKQKTEIE